jgi:predicted RNA-binding Zn-ribbon protein involved in translation (DUF1610 family)
MYKSVSVDFLCPECGDTHLSAVLKVTEYPEIVEMWVTERNNGSPAVTAVSGDVLDSYVDDVPFNFECHSCGFAIGYTATDAYMWLKEKGMLDVEE